MRIFIAIDLPQEIKNKIDQIQSDFKKCDLAFKWVKPENIHLTLKFLGEIKQDRLDEIKKTIIEVSQNFKAFQANLSEFGFFPNERRPRVFFIATSEQDLLKSIAQKLEEGLEKIGFEAEGRFKSHITLARIKSPQNIDCLKQKIKEIKLVQNLPIKEIILFKSTLTGTGPIYEKIFKSSLTS